MEMMGIQEGLPVVSRRLSGDDFFQLGKVWYYFSDTEMFCFNSMQHCRRLSKKGQRGDMYFLHISSLPL